jgi:hypothetical protein
MNTVNPTHSAIAHLVDEGERATRHVHLSGTPSIPWLGFDHDMTAHLTASIEDYPLRRNWTSEEIRILELGGVPASRSLDEALSMIQSWLFFGLLESAFGAPFATRDYVRSVNGREVMDTAELRTSIDDFRTHIAAIQDIESIAKEMQETIVESLRYAAAWNERLAKFSAFGNPLAANSETFISVARLTVLVAEAVWAIGQQFPTTEPRFFIDCTWRLETGYESELKRRVTSLGWCPTLFDRMNNFVRLPASFLEYMSIYPSPKTAPNRHRKCHTLTRCQEYNVDDPSTYQAAHRQKGCQCDNVLFARESVATALEASHIPVVDADKLLTSTSDDIIRSWSPSTPFEFVAYSHVWSDGLGSDTERGLPTCQVKYLRDLAVEVSGTPYIWIDSLCIPRLRKLRDLALAQMSESYRSSYVTIVLDAGIMTRSTLESNQSQLLAVSLSTYQERLWTLSESVLSSRITFAFKNEMKSSKDLLDMSATDQHLPVIRTSLSLLDNLSHGMHAGDVTIGALQRNLCRRTSSWPTDESLATASIMGLDLKQLLEVNDDERMMRFWKMANYVPRDIIIETSLKLQRDGFRWAPQSLMDLKCDVMMDFKDRAATVTENGLRGDYFLYRLRCPGPLEWSRPFTFYPAGTNLCLHLDKQDVTTEYTLLPGDAVCFSSPLDISQPVFGAILRPIQNGVGNWPTFSYQTLAIARLVPYEKLEGAEGVLGSLIMGITGLMSSYFLRAEEAYEEIIIR